MPCREAVRLSSGVRAVVEAFAREFVEANREVLRELCVASRDTSSLWTPSGDLKLEDFDVGTAGERILKFKV